MDVWGLNQELLRLHWLKGKGYRSGERPPLRGRCGPCPTFNHITVFGLHLTNITENLIVTAGIRLSSFTRRDGASDVFM
jgi:hypothetical protein